MLKKLFRTRPISSFQSSTDSKKLDRVLGAPHLMALGIGGIIGAGIFVLTGQVSALYAGPGIIFSFILSAVASALAGLCYAEFASLIPVAGSAYTYAYATMGEIFAWTIGWTLILEYLFTAATVSVGWSGYVVSFLKDWGITLPPYLLSPLNVPAVVINLIVLFFLYRGLRQSALFNNIVVTLKISVIGIFILSGMHYVQTDNWFPLIPPNTGEFGHFGMSGILRGAGVIFFAYVGFDAVSTLAQEAKNPQKDMPIGILGSLFVCTLLYIAVALVLTGIVPYANLNVPDPMAVAVNRAGEGLLWLRPIVKLGAIAGLSSVVLVMLLGQTRVFFAMAEDGLLPPLFSKVHPKHHSPYLSVVITGLSCALISGLLPIEVLGELVSIGTLLAFAIVCMAILVLRWKRPELKAAFRTPWVPFVPCAGAIISLVQMLALPLMTWTRLLVWLLIGYVIYFSYGYKKGRW